MARHLLCILLACPLATAQSSVVSPHSNYAKSEGSEYSSAFGSYPESRYQIADGNYRSTAMTITEIAFRLDHRKYTADTGMGRSWSNVKLYTAECDLSTIDNTFSTNATTIQTKVFDGPIVWPSQNTAPLELPAQWSLAIPFRSSYAYSGIKDLLNDFTFQGGSLNNNSPWTATKPHPYILDSFGVGVEAEGAPVSFGKIANGCRDSQSLSGTGAYLNLDTATFGPNTANPLARNKYFFEVTGANFGPRVPVVVTLAFGASTLGIPFPGVPCNNVHLQLGRVWFLYPVPTNTIGNIAAFNFGVAFGLVPYTPAWHGINMFVQAIWNDSATGALRFSAGSRNSFIAMPLEKAADVKMQSFYSPDPFASVASSGDVGNSSSIPIIRYRN